ncbi:MAG TPA: glycosyl transferase, partial [Edaphobacter sp.]|nr:glycosyl transferase [Edaphobacter sp.]
QQIEAELATLPSKPAVMDARISALLDVRNNPRLLRSTVMGVTPHPGNRTDLPRMLHGEHHDMPRIAVLSASYLRASNGTVDDASFTFFVRELQAHEPLLLQEIWILPSYLNFSLLEEILAQTEIALRDSGSESGVRLSVLMDSLRTASSMDWAPLLESFIVFDEWLYQDPTGTFSRMDADSRRVYRDRVALLARHSDFSESQVATTALQLAREGAQQKHSDPRVQQRFSHIGYYLVDKGIDRLAARVNFHPPLSYRLRSTIRRNADDFYITGIELITILFIAAALFPLLPNYPVNGKLIITFLMMIMPTMQCAVELINNSITAIFDPTPLPKLDFSRNIPSEAATLVVVPTLLLNESQVREMASEMEVRFLANRDPNLHFALLTDLPDSVSKPHTNDSSPLVDLAIQLIDDLNGRYAGSGNGAFILLHRHRIFNVRQGVWMGWERKRGKLLDLNKFLIGEYDAFPIKAGRLDALRTVRYILTLDSDTQLPSESAARMVGAIAHPLNQAVIDPKHRIVIEGYGILQPRVGVSVSSASRSRLAALYSGQSGFDIYTRAISDAYQDLYGEGIFTGKGIYEVAALHTVLNHRFPRNSLLSHDLIEGAYARVGLVTDIELIDDYPSHYSAYTRRKHRWVRGDWQIVQWMFSRVPDETGHKVPNPISTVSRWKIFDNLRRSLVEPFTFFLFIAGWVWLPGGPVYWTLVLLLLFFFPTVVQTVFGVGRALASRREGMVTEALAGSGHAALVALLNLFFLPHQAMLVLDAVFRALIRRFVTGERLLEWETAAEAESQTRRTTPVDRYLAMMPLLSVIIAIALFFRRSESLLIASPMLLGWCMATVLTAWLNRPPRKRK